jgi:predicted DNA-binding WGR domain protein
MILIHRRDPTRNMASFYALFVRRPICQPAGPWFGNGAGSEGRGACGLTRILI